MKRHKTLYLDNMEEFSYCGNKMITFEAGEYELPFSIKPTEGEHRYETCEDCRTQKKNLIETLIERTKAFPLCCDPHRNLINFKQYHKSNYEGLEEEIADKIMFSHHHITNHIADNDWYEIITEYLDYVVDSFGSFPKEFGTAFMLDLYIDVLLDLTKVIDVKLYSKTVSKNEFKIRLNKVSAYIDSRIVSMIANSKNNTDVNNLLSIYDKWFSTFPFDLSYFKHLKEHYRNKTPILSGEIIRNRYSGQKVAKANTKENLTRILIKTTKDIITNINGFKLHEKELLTDGEKIELELILKNRKLELLEMGSLDNTDSKEYLKILKKWFKEEKYFISSIKPYLPKTSTNKKIIYPESTRTHIAYCIHYLKETKLLITDNSFPSDKAWKELGERYNKSFKNIQLKYNEINSNSDVRISKTKIKVIRFVIDEMLTDYPKALKLAEKEFKLAELMS
tara:strand:- start:525 stop:1877 length:1353 start_codon:yes stop_codon:yes gene_type:complete